MQSIGRQEQVVLSCITHESMKWYDHFGKSFGNFLKKWNIPFPHDPVVPFLRDLSKRNENMSTTCPQNDLYANVYGRFINNSHKLEIPHQEMNGKTKFGLVIQCNSTQ